MRSHGEVRRFDRAYLALDASGQLEDKSLLADAMALKRAILARNWHHNRAEVHARELVAFNKRFAKTPTADRWADLVLKHEGRVVYHRAEAEKHGALARELVRRGVREPDTGRGSVRPRVGMTWTAPALPKLQRLPGQRPIPLATDLAGPP